VLAQAGFDVSVLKPFRMAEFAFDGGRLTISRTGFTGDLGYELWTTPDHALALWDHLFAAGSLLGITAIGTDALNLARIEAGFIITNMDFIPADQALREDRARSPFELGLDWMIDWDKGHFTGRRALAAEKANDSSLWALVGLDIEGNIPVDGSLIYRDGKTEVGYVTAAAWSPAAKRNIALAQVRRPHDRKGNLMVEVYALRELQYAKLMLQARVCPRPFFAPARRRATPPGRF
jgi:aminomethyltransferase